MRICITAQGNTTASSVDPRFGRCQYFMFCDTGADAFEAMENPHKDGSGAGILAAQVMADQNVSVVLTGTIGPNAFRALQAAAIKVMTDISGTVEGVYEQYKKGTVGLSAQGPSVDAHHGMRT